MVVVFGSDRHPPPYALMYDGEEQLRPGSFSIAWKALTDDVFGCGRCRHLELFLVTSQDDHRRWSNTYTSSVRGEMLKHFITSSQPSKVNNRPSIREILLPPIEQHLTGLTI